MADVWQRFIVDLPEVQALYTVMLNVRETCARVAFRTGNPAWLAVGQQAQRVQEAFAVDLDRIAVRVAAAADKLITDKLKTEIVRPPTGNNPGLQDGVQSEHVSTGRFSFGVVEVGLLDKLNSIVGDVSGQPYWETQEFGSHHNVGRGVRGFYYGAGGFSAPDPGQFRQHPVFVAMGGPRMVINKPIPAKHFMRDGSHEAEKLWRSLVNQAISQASLALDRIQFPVL